MIKRHSDWRTESVEIRDGLKRMYGDVMDFYEQTPGMVVWNGHA